MLKYVTILAVLFFACNVALGQGCSDAGFCTMGAMKPDQPYNKKVPFKLRSLEFSIYRGTTPISPVIYVATLDASFSIIDNKTSVQVKIPYETVSGNMGDNSGLSDISLCLTRNVYSTEKFDVSVSLGTKIKTNDSDKTSTKPEFEGLPLPMYYQTSLGTYDAIAGVSFITRKWLLATGIQYAFNRNGNQYSWQDWTGIYPDQVYLEKNKSALELKRGTDIMFRAERNFRYARFNFSLGLLPIIRVTNDEITDVNTGDRVKPQGAKGLALSAIATAGYSFNVKTGLKLLVGHKLVQREVNPDGLTREMVASVSYFYRF